MKSVDLSLQHYFFPNICEDGWKFISFCAVFSLIMAIIWFPLGCISVIFTIWCFYSFRDPLRVTPVWSGAVIAPTDGVIVAINREKGPNVLGLDRKNFTRISIYSGPFDAHILRMPIKSTIRKSFYDAGKNCSASLKKECMQNERLLFSCKHSDGLEFVLQHTATFCSKRIVAKIKSNQEFLAGQRFGIMRFGGYIDILLPDKVEPQVCVGQYLIGGETIIADIKSDAPRMVGDIR